MAGLARRLAPGLALGGVAVAIVAIADPAIAGHSDTTTVAAATAAASTTGATGTDSSTGATTQSSPQPLTEPSTAAAGTGDCANGQVVTAPSVTTRWGPVQVAATVVDARLCEVHAVVYPSGDQRSSQINAVAIPLLDESATARGIEFDFVSGATVTSQGYYSSLQQLLDSL